MSLHSLSPYLQFLVFFLAVINIISKRHLKKKWVYLILYFQATFNHGEKSEQEVKVGVWSRNEGGMLLCTASNSATFLIPSQAYLLKVAPPQKAGPPTRIIHQDKAASQNSSPEAPSFQMPLVCITLTTKTIKNTSSSYFLPASFTLDFPEP